VISGVGDYVSVCLLCAHLSTLKRKMAWAINTKVGTGIAHGKHLTIIDPEVRRSGSRSQDYHVKLGVKSMAGGSGVAMHLSTTA